MNSQFDLVLTFSHPMRQHRVRHYLNEIEGRSLMLFNRFVFEPALYGAEFQILENEYVKDQKIRIELSDMNPEERKQLLVLATHVGEMTRHFSATIENRGVQK